MITSGIININKPPGWSSFDVVSFVRRNSKIKRVGHAGTLDPSATGVLLICLGRASRTSQFIMSLPKLYCAEITLGISTDTYDGAGNIISESDIMIDLSEHEIIKNGIVNMKRILRILIFTKRF